MVHKLLIGVDGHDRLTSYLNFESGLVEKDYFFMSIIFNGHYLILEKDFFFLMCLSFLMDTN